MSHTVPKSSLVRSSSPVRFHVCLFLMCHGMVGREPSFCGADRAAWWELSLLSQHWHPSVAAFARSLLKGDPISFTGDPLRDLSLPAFLDKFVQRKAKVLHIKHMSHNLIWTHLSAVMVYRARSSHQLGQRHLIDCRA